MCVCVYAAATVALQWPPVTAASLFHTCTENICPVVCCRLLSPVIRWLLPFLLLFLFFSLNQTDRGEKKQTSLFLTKTHFYTSLIQEHGLQSITVWNNQTALSNHFVQTAFPQECYGKTHLCTVKQKPLVCILLIHFCNTHWSTVCSRFMKSYYGNFCFLILDSVHIFP